MPTKEVLSLLTDAPAAHLHGLYTDAAASIVEAYLASGFPFLAIDPDRERGFRLPEHFDTNHFPAIVDVVFITLADLKEVKLAKDRPELRAFGAQGSAYFAGRPEEQKASFALKSCKTRYEFGIPQAIIPPAAREIMDWVYPEQAQHLPDRTIAEQYSPAVADAWAELRQEAGMADPYLNPLFAHIETAWNADLPVIVGKDGHDYLVVPRKLTWTQLRLDD